MGTALGAIIGFGGGACFSALLYKKLGKRGTKVEPQPVCLVVQVEILPDHVEKFIEAITIDCEGSRTEPGCLRFDVLQDQEDKLKFTFFEVYKDQAAVAFHREQAHFKAWGNFKATGGVKDQKVFK